MQLSQTNQQDTLLRNTLFGNVGFTAVSTIAFLFAANPLAALMGIEYQWLLTVLGLGFIPFAAFVFYVATRQPMNSKLAWEVIIMDFGWVLLSYGYLLWAWSDLTVAGRWLVFLQAEAVFFFGLFQYLGMRRLN